MRSFLCLTVLGLALPLGAAPARPNILWITCEDTGPEIGCYGDTYSTTPNLDRFATNAMRYRNVWSVAPVCAPARTAIITGVYPGSLGGEHMRSEVRMPADFRMYPQFLRERGYYCTNNDKEDYNVTKPGKVWDESSKKAHYRNRAPGQPFFAIFNFTITHESQIRTRPHQFKHDPAKVRVPAYHPDTPEVRLDWAQYYDNITSMDTQAGKVLAALDADGLAEETIVFFYGDHGSGMPRSKRWPYNSGLQVPLMVRVPEKFKKLAPKEYLPGGWSERLVSFVDLAPTLLSLAGERPPAWMQGQAIMGEYQSLPPKHLHGLRGRMDERYDCVRSVRNERFIYVRNYLPHLIYGQHIDFMFQTPTTRLWQQLYRDDKLQPPRTYFWQPKPPEELYDLKEDRDEVNNLVQSPAHQAVLEELRQAQREQVLRVRDAGLLPEAEMHRRAAGSTIYEMARNPAKYPLERVLGMAEAASSLKTSALPQLREGLQDRDAAVRYWAVMGLLMRGTNGVQPEAAALRKRLDDESPSVRLASAQALGLFGTEAELEAVLRVLRELAQPAEAGAYVAMHAVNVIEALGPRADSLKPLLREMPLRDPKAPGRANSYVSRLVQEMTGRKALPE